MLVSFAGQGWPFAAGCPVLSQEFSPSLERYRTLANNKSSRKRILINETKRLRNRPYISAARTYLKKAELAIRAGERDTAAETVGEALSMLDRVASKGIIHRNNAARRKSRLMKKYNLMGEEAA